MHGYEKQIQSSLSMPSSKREKNIREWEKKVKKKNTLYLSLVSEIWKSICRKLCFAFTDRWEPAWKAVLCIKINITWVPCSPSVKNENKTTWKRVSMMQEKVHIKSPIQHAWPSISSAKSSGFKAHHIHHLLTGKEDVMPVISCRFQAPV